MAISVKHGPYETTTLKPGWKSTEFLLTALLIVAVTVLLGIGRISIKDVVDLWPLAASVGGYALSRGLAKKGAA